jgi:hypothetical protein
MGDCGFHRRHQVNALAAGELRPAIQSLLAEHIAQLKGGIRDQGPSETVSGIQVDDDPVRMLQTVHRRIPRMQLDGADRDEADQARDAIDPETSAFTALASLDFQLVHNVRDRREFPPCGRT